MVMKIGGDSDDGDDDDDDNDNGIDAFAVADEDTSIGDYPFEIHEVRNWNIKQVASWVRLTLQKFPFEDIEATVLQFENNQILGEVLHSLTKDDLTDMKVRKVGLRRVLLQAIDDFF